MGKGVSFSAFGNGRQKISGVRGLFQGQNIHTFLKGILGVRMRKSATMHARMTTFSLSTYLSGFWRLNMIRNEVWEMERIIARETTQTTIKLRYQFSKPSQRISTPWLLGLCFSTATAATTDEDTTTYEY